jgi:hypothetical protein
MYIPIVLADRVTLLHVPGHEGLWRLRAARAEDLLRG